MEEQLTSLLTNILANTQAIPCVNMNILEKYYQLFEKKKYLGNNFEDIYNDMKKLYNIDLQSLKYGYNNQEEQIIYQSLILAIVNENDIKKKVKLIPLIIYLDNNRIFYDYLYKINYFDDFVYGIKDFFVGTISDSGVRVNNIEELSPYHQEKKWFENYKKGIENLNFKQIYSFIDGIERGMGHQFDIYLDFLIFIAYKYFFEDLVKIANNKKDIFEIIYLTHILNIEETFKLAIKSTNYLLKFEFVRKAVYFKYNNYYCLNLLKVERDLLKDIIVQLSKDCYVWEQFLDYYLEYPLRSIQLFEPMSKAIKDIDKKCISSLIQAIKIDKYMDDNSKEALNSLILNIKNDLIQKEILEKLFYRWDDFIDNYNEYFGSIILTDVIDIVIIYIRDFLDKTLVIKNINKILDNLDEIDNIWFKDKIEQTNYFYKQMSKLFVYAFVLDKYELNEIKEKISIICNNNQILKKEQGYQAKTTLQLFETYII
jgi:hypothetical protein